MWDENIDSQTSDKLKYIIPGDMVSMDLHCGIIQTVVYSDNATKEIDKSNCAIIEATAPDYDYRVLKGGRRNLANHINWYNNYKIVRLRIQ